VIDVGAILAPEHVTGVVRRVVEEQTGEVAEIVSKGYPGESSIVDPRGEIIAGPVEGEQILVADCSEEQIFAAKAACDVAGHYSRPDVFQLHVNRTPHRRVVEMQEPDYEITVRMGTNLDL
jgi:predicted amidohydrolase